MMKTHRFPLALAVTLVLIALATGCISRYRQDLFVTFEETTKKVRVEQTTFTRDAVLESGAIESGWLTFPPAQLELFAAEQ